LARPRWGAYSTPQDPQLHLREPTSKGSEGRRREGMERKGRGRKGRRWERTEMEGKNVLPHSKQAVAAYATLCRGSAANLLIMCMLLQVVVLLNKL